jgi:hypothetical protein
MRGREPPEKRGLSGVWFSNEANVGDEPELYVEFALSARFTRLGEAWGLLARGSEVGIALSATATVQEHLRVTVLQSFEEHLTGVAILYDRPWRQLDDRVFSISAVAFAATSRLATLGLEEPIVGQMDERAQVALDANDHVAATPSVTSVGSTLRDVLLPPK